MKLPLRLARLLPAEIAPRDLGIACGLFGFSFAILTMASSRLGVVDGEAGRLDVATGYGRLLWTLAHEGLAAVTRDDVARELGAAPLAPLVPDAVAGYTWLALARRTDGAWVSALTALRLPAVVMAATVPSLVFLLAREVLVRRWAVLAALFAFLGPRLLVDAVSLGGGGTLVATTLAGLLFQRIAARRGAVWAALLAGVALGLALAQSLSITLVFAVFAFVAWQEAREGSDEGTSDPGRFPLPRAIGVPALVAPVVAFAVSPRYQPLSAEAVLRVFERAFSPAMDQTQGLGHPPTGLVPPRLHVLEALLSAVPSSVLVLALVGLASAFLPRARKAAQRMWTSLAPLLVVFVGAPMLLPRALSAYPSAWQLAVPFLAIAAARGGMLLAEVSRHELLVVALCLVEPLASSSDFSTVAAAAPWLVRSVARDSSRARLDGAIVGPLARFLPPRGTAVRRIYAPEIPTASWEPMRRFRGLPPVVLVRRPDDADVVITSRDRQAPSGFFERGRLVRGGRPVLVVYGRMP